VHKGWLVSNGNRDDSVKAKASLTVRPTGQAESKDGLSDPPTRRGTVGA